MTEEEQTAPGRGGAATPPADAVPGDAGYGGAGPGDAASGDAASGGAASGAAASGGSTGEHGSGAHGSGVRGTGGAKLRRSRRHKVAGGVCGGLGRYFDLDPVIFRVPLVVLSVVGGLGLVFYGFAWLFIPSEGARENEAGRLLSGRVETGSLSAILVALVGCGLFLASLGSRNVPFSVLLIGAVAGAAYWSQHRRQAEVAGAEGARVDPTVAHAVADAPPETQAPPAPFAPPWWREPLTKEAGASKGGPGSAQRGGVGYLWGPEEAVPHAALPREAPGGFVPPGPRGLPGVRPKSAPPARQNGGSLGGLVFLLAVLAGGIALAASWDTNPLGTTLTIGLSCTLAVFGLGLAVSAFVGRVGIGTIVALVLTAGLLAGAAALPKDISAQFRDVRWVPTATKDVERRYELGSGTGELDLRELGLRKDQSVRSEVRVGAGEMKVVVPADVTVKADADVGVGEARFPKSLDADGDIVFDSAGGFGQGRSMTLRPLDGAVSRGTIEIKASVGLGRVEIVRELPSGERSDRLTGTGASAPTAEPREGENP